MGNDDLQSHAEEGRKGSAEHGMKYQSPNLGRGDGIVSITVEEGRKCRN